MKHEDSRAQKWRELLLEELAEARMSQSELGRRIGRTPAQVNQWLSDDERYGPPKDPDVIFAIEDVLDCRDRLAMALGYVRPGSVPDVERAIRVDPALSRAQRQMLLDLYRTMVERSG